MTASEFAFLALGLVLGGASGAALVEVLRSRPPAPREVRVTVAPNSIRARRAATLANETLDPAAGGPATGGPGDRRWTDIDPTTADPATVGRRVDDHVASASSSPSDGAAVGTPVRVAAGPPPAAIAPGSPRAPMRLSPATAGGPSGGLVAVPMSLEPDPITQALRATAAAVSVAAMSSGDVARRATGARVGRAGAEVARSVADGSAGGGAANEAATGSLPTAAGATDPAGPCADERRVADERCAVAVRAREGAAAAAETLRVAQRTYDDHVGQADGAAAAADPRAVRTVKELAQHRFRDARAKAASRDDVESAARAWLGEINEINRATREATQRIERDRAAAAALAPVLERLAVEADAARISAERADEACLAAREAVAACDEARTLAAAAAAAAPTAPTPEPRVGGAERMAAAAAAEADELEPATPMGSRSGDDAVILRILRGDRDAMLRVVARLAGDDPEARRRWQGLLSGLAEALVARSIEASAFDFPHEHPFWGPFNQAQSRDIATGLASLGYRFDGFGGWVDDRVPSQRDLAMAVGYAGLDPMRIRRWPTEAESQELLREVRVAADDYVAAAAGGLTLGEMVTLLGLRADGLTELWNDWGIVRPILLEAI